MRSASRAGGSDRTVLRRLAAPAIAVALVTGCSTPDAPHPAHPGQPAQPAQPAPKEPTDELRLGLNEWSVETAGATLLPGEVQVVVTNAGGTGHDVVIHGRQGTWASPVLAPGEVHEMTITVAPGETLELVCTLEGHHAQGMHTTIDVTEGA